MRNIFLALLFFTFCFPSAAQWTRTNGPEGVAVSFLTTIDGTIYAGTEVNGVYISTDDGVTWLARNAGIETFEVSSIIKVDTFLYAGTFRGGVYRSSDNGITWLPPATGGNLFITSLIVNNPYIYAGAASLGLYRSSDGGVNWTLVTSGLYVSEMCLSNKTLFVSESNYTFATTDHGVTWRNVTDLEGAAVFSFFTKGNTIFVGGRNEIYRSTDNGITFQNIPVYFNFGIVNVYDITEVDSTLFMATSYDGVYKSTDNGNTWSQANSGMGPKDVRAVTETNQSTLLAGSHYVGMYRSTDLGQSWNKSMSGFPAGISVLCLLEDESSIYAGTRDGMYRTDDNGDNWYKLASTNDTINYSSVWSMCVKNGVIYASTFLQFHTTVYSSTDKGATWMHAGHGLPSNLSFLKSLAASGNNIVAGTDEGIYYTSDDGKNWQIADGPQQTIESLASSGNYVYAAVPSGYGIYRSLDSGVNWILSLLSTVDYVEVAAIDNYAFAGSFFGGARYSTNYGSTWFASDGFPPETSVFVIYPVTNQMILAGTDLDPTWIYQSPYNGSFYVPYGEGLAANASTEAFTSNDTYMFAGTDYNGVWRRYLPGVPVELASFTAEANGNSAELKWITATEKNNHGFEIYRMEKNSGEEWQNIGFVKGNGTTAEPEYYTYTDKDLVNGDYSYRLRQLDHDGSSRYLKTVDVTISQPTEFALYQNYPNPFNPVTSIKYSLEKAGFVDLSVFNAVGQRIAVLVNEMRTAGTYIVKFDALTPAGGLPSGVYIYKLQADDRTETRKMLLLK